MINNQSPYYLHPLDAPSTIITAIKYDGKNDLWENSVIIALATKNKVAFIDGTIINPDMKKGRCSKEASEWIVVNFMITSWILNAMDPKRHASLAYVDCAQPCGRIS